MLFFFFFQAEDGIRDTSVTGVQTCALPIWVFALMLSGCGDPQQRGYGLEDLLAELFEVHDIPYRRAYRSEERRVGKECRSRWGRDHLKKKKKTTRRLTRKNATNRGERGERR